MWSLALASLLVGLWPGEEKQARGDAEAALETSADARGEAAKGVGDPGARTAEIVRLGTIGGPDNLGRIAAFLDSGDSSSRLAAARVLVRAGDARALLRMAAQASESSAPQRFEALTVLREAKSLPVEARRAAERALADADAALRLASLDVLTAHPSADSVTAVAGSLIDGNRDVRLSAINLLGRLPDPRGLMPLLDRSATADRTERAAILRALGGYAHIHPRLDPGPAVLQQVSDINEDVRLAAVDALGRLRVTAAVPVLRALASRPAADPRVARRAILALGDIGNAAAIGALVEFLRAPAPAEEAVSALQKAGTQAVQPVAAVVGDGFPTSAIAAATLLGALGDRGATPALLRALKTRRTVAISAARALETLRDENAVAELMEAVTAPPYAKSPGVREACLKALAAIGDARATRLIEAAVGDPDPWVRAAGLELAAALRAGLSRESLIRRLQDADAMVRAAAIKAATNLPRVDVGTELLRALPSIAALDSTARARLCSALARAALPAADAYLADLLERDPDDGVRAAAAWSARARRGVPAIVAALEHAAREPMVPVAANAAAAIDSAIPLANSRAAAPGSTPNWITVRAVSPDGAPVVGKWLRVRVGSRIVWMRTGENGVAWLADLPDSPPADAGTPLAEAAPGAYWLSLAPDDQDALTAATASGKSPATTPGAP